MFIKNWKVYSLNVKMMRYKFQINFIFVFCVIIQVNFSILQEREENVRVFFEEEKCVNTNCCDDFRKLPSGIVCRKSMNPPYSSNMFEFTDIKYLPARVFQEKLVRSIYIDHPDVTVDSNVLDGISTLGTFYVQRSNIKSFATDEFSSLEELLLLNIEHNQTKAIDLLHQLPHLQTLNVKNNDIDAITFDPVPVNLKLMYLATFVIFCLATKVLHTKLNIKVFLSARDFAFVGEEDLGYGKLFDAFISFSHDDDEFAITQIISEIERRNPFIRLCLHYRHFMPGELIITNITRAVQNSRRTVIILTRNYLESEWCLLEARMAHSQAMKDKVHRIIVIKVGDLPKEMDPLIKSYLDSTTYLTWGERYFWNKLLFVLPSPVCGRGNVPDHIEDNETVV